MCMIVYEWCVIACLWCVAECVVYTTATLIKCAVELHLRARRIVGNQSTLSGVALLCSWWNAGEPTSQLTSPQYDQYLGHFETTYLRKHSHSLPTRTHAALLLIFFIMENGIRKTRPRYCNVMQHSATQRNAKECKHDYSSNLIFLPCGGAAPRVARSRAVLARMASTLSSSLAYSNARRRPYKCVLLPSDSNAFFASSDVRYSTKAKLVRLGEKRCCRRERGMPGRGRGGKGKRQLLGCVMNKTWWYRLLLPLGAATRQLRSSLSLSLSFSS